MKNIILILALLSIASCASEQTIAYEKARLEANPHYQTDDINPAYNYTPKDKKLSDYIDDFACSYKYRQHFNADDTYYICH